MPNSDLVNTATYNKVCALNNLCCLVWTTTKNTYQSFTLNVLFNAIWLVCNAHRFDALFIDVEWGRGQFLLSINFSYLRFVKHKHTDNLFQESNQMRLLRISFRFQMHFLSKKRPDFLCRDRCSIIPVSGVNHSRNRIMISLPIFFIAIMNLREEMINNCVIIAIKSCARFVLLC